VSQAAQSDTVPVRWSKGLRDGAQAITTSKLMKRALS
jgi:hypothetical protein